MTEMLSATAARNFVGGAWSESASGETYEKHNPWRPSEVTGVFAASTADDARAAVGRPRGVPRLGRTARARARRVPVSRQPTRSRPASSRSRTT